MTYPSYRNNDRKGGYKPGGFHKRAGGFDRPELHDAICAECGTQTQVPFRPNGSKPVLCRACFKKDEGFEPNRSYEKRPFEKRPFSKPFERREGGSNVDARLKAIEDKLDAIMKAIGA